MACAGRRGDDVRSDCWINVEPASGLTIHLDSKVKALYGKQIEAQVRHECELFDVSNAHIDIKDFGALPFVMSARLETALRRSGFIDSKQKSHCEGEERPKQSPTKGQTPPDEIATRIRHDGFARDDLNAKDRLRRSRLYLPGNTPHLFLNAGLHEPDGIILDLEDSVSPDEKDAARVLVRNALCEVDFMTAERMVRINQLPMGLDDLEWIVPFGVQLILIPKCESAEQVRQVDEKIAKLDPGYPIWLLPIIESARGCFAAFDIADASPHVAALTIGLEDYTADIGVARTPDNRESFWAQSLIINAAKAHGLQAISSVFSDVDDITGLRRFAYEARALGFDGMGCIHPRQIPIVHDEFAPTLVEIKRAKQIVLAFEEAKQKGLGAVSLGGKMIDAPVVKRAQTTIRNAIKIGVLDSGWQSEDRVGDL